MTEFKSLLKDDIALFLRQKRAAGYPYEHNEMLLARFDALAKEQFPNEARISREMVEAWLNLLPGEHPNGLLRRVTPIRQLAKFIAGNGKEAYILPGGIPSKQIKYTPYIYSEEELSSFFSTVDRHDYSYLDSIHQWTPRYVLPVIFRVYYCLGLRNSEARMLHRSDVDLETGEILVRESKGWRRRIVVASEDLVELLAEYDSEMDSRMPGREMFFPCEDGKAFARSRLDLWFRRFLEESGIRKEGIPQRIHDLRHTHCVHLLNRWVKEGKDLEALYPYMSEHLGHRHFSDTDYYLTLSKEFYPELEKRMKEINDDILPEVCHAED